MEYTLTIDRKYKGTGMMDDARGVLASLEGVEVRTTQNGECRITYDGNIRDLQRLPPLDPRIVKIHPVEII